MLPKLYTTCNKVIKWTELSRGFRIVAENYLSWGSLPIFRGLTRTGCAIFHRPWLDKFDTTSHFIFKVEARS